MSKGTNSSKGAGLGHRRNLHFACTDYWVAAVWIAWVVLAAAAMAWWMYGQSPWLSSATLVIVGLSVVVPAFLSFARRSARVILSRRSSFDDKRSAWGIAWHWRQYAPQLFDPKKDRGTGKYMLPGLYGLQVDDDGLELVIQVPHVRLARTALTDVETMADVLGVDEVRYLYREGDQVHYLVVPVDLTEDDRHAISDQDW